MVMVQLPGINLGRHSREKITQRSDQDNLRATLNELCCWQRPLTIKVTDDEKLYEVSAKRVC